MKLLLNPILRNFNSLDFIISIWIKLEFGNPFLGEFFLHDRFLNGIQVVESFCGNGESH